MIIMDPNNNTTGIVVGAESSLQSTSVAMIAIYLDLLPLTLGTTLLYHRSKGANLDKAATAGHPASRELYKP